MVANNANHVNVNTDTRVTTPDMDLSTPSLAEDLARYNASKQESKQAQKRQRAIEGLRRLMETNPEAVAASRAQFRQNAADAPVKLNQPREFSPEGAELSVAQELMENVFTQPGSHHVTLVYYQGNYWTFTEGHWQQRSAAWLRRCVATVLDNAYYMKQATQADVEKGKADVKGEDIKVLFTPTARRLAAYTSLLTDMVTVEDSVAVPFTLRSRQDGLVVTEVPRTRPLVVFRDKTVEVATGEAIRNTPALFTTTYVDTDYQPDADAPMFHSLLETLFSGKRRTIRLAKQLLGAHVARLGGLQALYVLTGTKGSGKSTFTQVLENVVTGTSAAHVTTQSLGGDHGAEQLVGRSLVVLNDMDNAGRIGTMATSVLKQVSGGDPLHVNPKGRTAFSTHVHAQVLMVSNQPPVFTDPTGAMESRLRYLRADGPTVRGTDTERRNYAQDLLEAELAGIANAALVGAREVLDGGLVASEDQVDMEAQARLDGIITLDLLQDMDTVEITGHPEDSIPLATLVERLRMAASGRRDLGRWAASRRNVERDLETSPAGVCVARPRQANGTRARVVAGVRDVPFNYQAR